MRENPANSTHWLGPTGVGTLRQGSEYDECYDTGTPAAEIGIGSTPLQMEHEPLCALEPRRLAPDSWEDADDAGDEAPIPPIHAGGIHCSRGVQPWTAMRDNGGFNKTTPDTDSSQGGSNNLNHSQALMSGLLDSLRRGSNAYVHCTSGFARSPIVAAVIMAGLAAIDGDHFENDDTRHGPTPQHHRPMDQTRGA